MVKTNSVEYRIREIDDNLWWAFKALCALEKTPINEKITQLIREAVQESGLKPKGE